MPANTQKLNCQGPTNNNCAPNSGANNGANIITNANREKKRTASSPRNKSRTTARATTAPAAPAIPWTNRNTTNTVTLGTNTHSTEATVNTAIPTNNGRRRPNASLIGPMINCPNDNPNIIEVNVSCTCASTVPRSSVICGNAGRYMSVASGPVAVSRPSTNTRSTTDRRDLGRTTEDSGPSCSSATEPGEFGDRTGTPVHM